MAPARSQLYSRWDHQGGDTLLVYFNGYGSPARGVRTHLDGFAGLTAFGSSTLWFAESGDYSWYTDFDRRIQATIRFAVEGHGIRRLLLMGSSAGGYAAIRHAALLPALDGLRQLQVLAVNPQTGFDDMLLGDLRRRIAACGWPATDLGRDPILPAPQRIDAGQLLGPPGLRALLAQRPPGAPALQIDLHHDAGNPVDNGFAQALLHVPGLRLHPQPLGLPHRLGSGALLQSEALRLAAEQALATAPAVKAPAPARKPFLALFRSGPGSLHTTAVRRLAAQNYDYALSHHGDSTPPALGAVFVNRQPGAKWPALAATLRQHWAQVSQYQHVWLADDDLLCDPETLSRLFATCAAQQLDHALPRLTPVSPRDAESPLLSTARLARWLPSLAGGPPPGEAAVEIDAGMFRRIGAADPDEAGALLPPARPGPRLPALHPAAQ